MDDEGKWKGRQIMNYSDPRLQRLLLRGAAKQPYGGVANRSPGLPEYLQNEEKRKLQMGEVGLRSQLQKAQIEQMGFERGMSEKRLGLEQGYFGLAEKGMGLKEQELGIQSRLSELRGQEMAWKNKMFMKKLSDEEKNLNLSTAFGLGTAAWSGYEGYRRAEKTRRETEINDLFYKDLENRGLLKKRKA